MLFCKDLAWQRPNETAALAKYRRSALGLPEQPEEGRGDLRSGGRRWRGLRHLCRGVSGPQGLTVALVQDRPVLGRWQFRSGRLATGIQTATPIRIGTSSPSWWKRLREETTPCPRKLTTITQAEHRAAEPRPPCFSSKGSTRLKHNGLIRAVVAQHIRTARRLRLAAPVVCRLHRRRRGGLPGGSGPRDNREGHMGPSNLWRVEDTGRTEPFPRCLSPDTML